VPQENPQEWSDQETLLLLEGLELYGDNWAEIAEHVGTRSQVSHVVILPLNIISTPLHLTLYFINNSPSHPILS
jgi:hypothetical protein